MRSMDLNTCEALFRPVQAEIMRSSNCRSWLSWAFDSVASARNTTIQILFMQLFFFKQRPECHEPVLVPPAVLGTKRCGVAGFVLQKAIHGIAGILYGIGHAVR